MIEKSEKTKNSVLVSSIKKKLDLISKKLSEANYDFEKWENKKMYAANVRFRKTMLEIDKISFEARQQSLIEMKTEFNTVRVA